MNNLLFISGPHSIIKATKNQKELIFIGDVHDERGNCLNTNYKNYLNLPQFLKKIFNVYRDDNSFKLILECNDTDTYPIGINNIQDINAHFRRYYRVRNQGYNNIILGDIRNERIYSEDQSVRIFDDTDNDANEMKQLHSDYFNHINNMTDEYFNNFIYRDNLENLSNDDKIILDNKKINVLRDAGYFVSNNVNNNLSVDIIEIEHSRVTGELLNLYISYLIITSNSNKILLYMGYTHTCSIQGVLLDTGFIVNEYTGYSLYCNEITNNFLFNDLDINTVSNMVAGRKKYKSNSIIKDKMNGGLVDDDSSYDLRYPMKEAEAPAFRLLKAGLIKRGNKMLKEIRERRKKERIAFVKDEKAFGKKFTKLYKNRSNLSSEEYAKEMKKLIGV